MATRLLFDRGWFEPLTGTLQVPDRQVVLRPRTAAVLACLMRAADRVVSREELMRTVWMDTVVTDDSLSQCLKEIRRALGLTADHIRTVPRIGYAFVGPVQESDAGSASAPDTAERGNPPRSRIRWSLAGIGALALVALTLPGLRDVSAPEPLSLVMLPLRTPDAETSYIAEAFTETLTRDFSRISGSFVIARATAASYGPAPPRPKELGRQLGVRYVVEGTLQREGADVRTVISLIDAADEHLVWTDEAAGPAIDMERRSIDMVGRLARGLHLRMIDAEAERARRKPPAHRDAYDLAMQGWSLWNRQERVDNARARTLFEQATRLDPENVMAWSGLANTYISDIFLGNSADRVGALSRARACAERAYALDPQHGNAIGSFATVLAMQGQLPEALALFRAQVQINPNYAPAHMWTAIVLTSLGEPEKALQSARLAERLSPRDPRLAYFRNVQARALVHAGNAKAARKILEETVALPGLGGSARPFLAALLVEQGELDGARELARKHLLEQPGYTLADWRAAGAVGVERFRTREQALLGGASRAGLPG